MPAYVYVALGGENCLLSFAMAPATGALTPLARIALPGAPGPLAVDPLRRFVYAGIRSTRQVCSFALQPRSGDLSLLRTVDLEADPCYISVDRRGRYLMYSSYSGGLVAVHRIGDDGAALAEVADRQVTAPCAHSIQTDPTNRFAFVPHVTESNALFQFRFDEETGRLTALPTPKVVPEGTVGPRHYEFHPSLPMLYCDNEQGSSVTVWQMDPEQGLLTPVHSVPTVPAGFTGENTCAQIHLAAPGRFLYVSNRGHNSIACFAIEAGTGHLRAASHCPTEPMPRAFNVDPYGRYLYATGLGSGRLASYRIDPFTGHLTPLAVHRIGRHPMWVLPVELPITPQAAA